MTIDLNLGDTQRIIAECRSQGCTRAQTAYILATAKWETAHTMKPVREAYWLSEKWRQQNLRYFPWYGRGYVQLTWQENYRRAGEKLGRDLTTDPDAVMKPDRAAPILVRGMMEGWFTGKALTNYIRDDKTDFHEARRVVNGTDKASDIARIAQQYDLALRDVWAAPEPVNETPKNERIGWGAIIAAILSIFKGGKA